MKKLSVFALTAMFAFAFEAGASGASLPNASKRMEWAKISGVYALDSRSSPSCDRDTGIEIEVLESNYENDPTVVFHNLTQGARAGRPRHIFSKINRGDDSRTVEGAGGRYLEVTVQQRKGWTLVEKKALYGVLVDMKPALPKDYTAVNWEFDLFENTVTTCKAVFDFKMGWKGSNRACATVTPVTGPCVYKRAD